MFMSSRYTKMMLVWFAVLAAFAIAACGENGVEGRAGTGGTSSVPDEPTAESPRLDEPSSTPTPTNSTPTSSPDESPSTGETALTVIVDDGPGAEPRMWELTCDPPGGTHPDAAAACGAIIAADEAGEPFAALPADAICTDIYGGPQEAAIKGTWRGIEVSAKFSRENGCEIARWDKLLAVFQTPLSPTRG